MRLITNSLAFKTYVLIVLQFAGVMQCEAQWCFKKRKAARVLQMQEAGPACGNSISYGAALKAVDSLLQLRQFRDAELRISDIRQAAFKDHRPGYAVKSILLLSGIISATEETEYRNVRIWKLLQESYQTAHGAYRTLLGVEMADFLRRSCFDEAYYSEDGIWQDTSANPSLWSPEKLHAEIRHLLINSIDSAAGLVYGAYLQPVFTHTEDYELYIKPADVIALRAIDLLTGMHLKTAGSYRMPDPDKALAPAAEFIKADFSSAEDPYNDFLILNLYRKILLSYQVYTDLQRLNFVRQRYQAEALWRQKAMALYREQLHNPESGRVLAELAEAMSTDSPLLAERLITDFLKRFPAYALNTKLESIRRGIEKPELSIQTESIWAPGRKLLLNARYKNTDTVYYRLYQVQDYKAYLSFMDNNYNGYGYEAADKLLRYISGFPLQSEGFRILPAYSDFRTHTCEFSLDGLKGAYYVLVYGDSPDLLNSGIAGFTSFSVSDKTLLETDNAIYLMHAQYGTPVAGADYTIWSKSNRWNKSEQFAFFFKGKTDAAGKIKLPESENRYRFYLLETDSGRLFNTDFFYSYRPAEPAEQESMAVQILTDRSIYRPGQKVMFKCIVYHNKAKKIIPGHVFKATLADNNGEIRGELTLTSNRFGSASGSFDLPAGGFNTGQFSIRTGSSGYTAFQVEEYKRPSFTAEFIKPEMNKRLNDTVEIEGIAMALAGYPVNGARVDFSVERRENQPWFRSFKSISHSVQAIASGRVETNSAGKFKIRFPALADPLKGPEENPVYVFTVQANITDINGEQRTCIYALTLGYNNLEIGVETERRVLNNKPADIRFYARNPDGRNLPFTGTIRIRRQVESEPYRKSRFWEMPDTTLIDAESYRIDFAAYAAGKTKAVFEEIALRSFTSDSSGHWLLPAAFLRKPGAYTAVMDCMAESEKHIHSSFDFKVFDTGSDGYKLPDPLSVFALTPLTLEPGSDAILRICSGLDSIWITATAISKRGQVYAGRFLLNASSKEIRIPVKHEDRGNIQLRIRGLRDYRLYEESITIAVPYTNKQLQVKLNTFRDKLEPGGTEQWRISLKGPASEKAAIELAAVMYDKSLDELYPNSSWNWWPYSDFYHWDQTQTGLSVADARIFRDYPDVAQALPEFRIPDYAEKNNFMVLRFMRGGSRKYLSEFGLAEHDDAGSGSGVAAFANSAPKANAPSGNTPAPGARALQLRRNFSETAFFFPHLYAGADGDIQVQFSMPQTLSSWRMQMLAHSSTMQLGYAEHTVQTSKKLMLQPNMPRFLREGDTIRVSSKVTVQEGSVQSVRVGIKLTDAGSGADLNWTGGANIRQIRLSASGSTSVDFEIRVPQFTGQVNIRISAESDAFSDAEQHTLPVLPNRSFVTRSLPLTLRHAGTHSFSFSDLTENKSQTLSHYRLSAEISGNPLWYVVQSLPYMMENPGESAEQIFTALYGNTIAAHLSRHNPEMARVFKEWESKTPGNEQALQSVLMKNIDLKNTVLEETPWLRAGRSETERLQQLGFVFAGDRIEKAIKDASDKLRDMQNADGSWSWYRGMPPNVCMTQTILIGFGKLKRMGADIAYSKPVIEKAIAYLDAVWAEQWERQLKSEGKQALSHADLQYLFCRSLFPEYSNDADIMLQYFANKAETDWNSFSLLLQAQTAMSLKVLLPFSPVPALIVKSFDQTLKQSPELGIYWPGNTGGWFWYESAIETHCAIMDAYRFCGSGKADVKEMELWLLRQKQSTAWSSTRSTADACFALLGKGSIQAGSGNISIKLGGRLLHTGPQQAGTAYFRTDLPPGEIKPESGRVEIRTDSDQTTFGALYWQYFEDNNLIQAAGSGIRLSKVLYKQVQTEKGMQKQAIKAGDTIAVGDVLEVVLHLQSDRTLEFVSIRDQRAAGTEPSAVLSAYMYKGGVGYYQSQRDAGTGLFIDRLEKGNYRFSYLLKAESAGSFSTGMASAQCLYAPEFTANSSVFRLHVK